jgi:hypothetical protein
MPGSAPVGDACIIPLSQTLSTAALHTAPTGALNLVAIIGGGGVALMVVALSAWRRRVTRRS